MSSTTPTAPFNESIQDVVARENARRKRVFLAFLALLLVPIAIGAYALTKAPSETAKVANDVAPIVTERGGGEIAARVSNDVASRAEPLIRASVAREINATVEPRIASLTGTLTKDITDLQTTVHETSAFAGKLSGTVDQNANALQALQTDQNRLRQEVTDNNDGASSRQQFAELRQSMAKELGSIRDLAAASAETANANKAAIDALARKVAALEVALKRQQSRAPNGAATVRPVP
jgi:septal ring factor EnvC (AmiA/AmiB activator)